MTEKKFSQLAEELLRERYLKEGEDAAAMFSRVASWVSKAEEKDKERWKRTFFDMMDSLRFLPNSPCLMNAGTAIPQLAACFVYPIEDDLESIFDTLKLAALTHKSGGGTGFSFSRLRPRGDRVGMTGGKTSGPVSFMEVYDKATDAIRQGGKRRGANMAVLRVDHPDIEEFIDAKQNEDKLNNFNISVAITDEFMEAVRKNADYALRFPAGGDTREMVSASDILDKIVLGAWRNGEPGVLFIDRINSTNPLLKLGDIEATNPCGEMPLLPYEACILGSVNLSGHVKAGVIDRELLEDTVRNSVRFLDDAIDVSDFPMKEIHDMVKNNRKIGLGVMGFADMLVKMGIPYSSEEAVEIGREVMHFIKKCSHAESERLAEEKGEFPNFFKSDISVKRRNAMVTTIAPTGTISIIAGTTSGIEPIYSLMPLRRSEGMMNYTMLDRLFEEKITEAGIPVQDVVDALKEKGSIQKLDFIPEDLKDLFRTATEIAPRVHVVMQSVFQGSVDNAISKTVNIPEDFSLDEVKDIILEAYRTGCKGITVYRQHSREQQVLDIVCECEK